MIELFLAEQGLYDDLLVLHDNVLVLLLLLPACRGRLSGSMPGLDALLHPVLLYHLEQDPRLVVLILGLAPGWPSLVPPNAVKHGRVVCRVRRVLRGDHQVAERVVQPALVLVEQLRRRVSLLALFRWRSLLGPGWLLHTPSQVEL